MEVLRASSVPSFHIRTTLDKTKVRRPMFLNFHSNPTPSSTFSLVYKKQSKFKVFNTISSTVSTEPTNPPEPVLETHSQGEKFDWYSQWYPVMPICDLDKRRPHAKKVIGLDVVVWWDRNEETWKVFDDRCPHRLAPLSEGRIDQWGRLQCVYHGWCFNGSGNCKFIPQANPDGPPVQTAKKACVAVYPSTVQNNIVWFWPNLDPRYKDILVEKKPPYIPEIDDPSYTNLMGNRDIPYGSKFIAPYLFYACLKPDDQDDGSESSAGTRKDTSVQQEFFLIFFCIPVSPGSSRLIWSFPRNFGHWIDKVVPRWIFHMGQNLVIDSDLYLLHIEERKIMDVGPVNWQKACFVPTKSDAFVIGFRKWLNKYAGGQVDWRGKYSGALPPTPPREQLMDRYWSHVVNCPSCSAAYKCFNVLEVVLRVVSVASIAIAAAAKQGAISVAVRTTMVLMAVLFYASSRSLARFIYKNFHYHDYDHAFR
uniref:Rieske domain-containing protein n=1 Tax=Quercus lobata TaxID=97700 RepID=A0A7N2KLE2_QUELO